MEKDSSTCVNCSTSLKGPICHICGQKQVNKRWSVRILWTQFINQLTNIEKGFFYTIKSLFVDPSKIIVDYWKGSTISYYNPFRFLIILTAINLLLSYWLGINDMLQEYVEPGIVDNDFTKDEINTASQKFDSWLNFLVLLLVPVNALFTRLFFRKSNNNYAEHLIMNSFIFGQTAFISSFTQFIFFAIPSLFVIFLPFNFMVGWVYNSYVYKHTFNEKITTTVLKALIIGILGVTVFFGLVILFSAVALALSNS
jgi:hypothetical protein